MDISVCSIKQLLLKKELLQNQTGLSASVICSSYPVNESEFLWLNRRLILQFDDTLNIRSERCFTEAQAAQTADFIMALDEQTELYVCCDSGESRSAAVAAALYRSCGMDEMVIWRNPHYHPNEVVYRRMCDALNIAVTQEMLDVRKQINSEALAQAVREARGGDI